MKIKKYLYLMISLFWVVCITIFIHLFLICPALKDDLDKMLSEAINIEMIERLNYSSVCHQMRVLENPFDSIRKVGIYMITDEIEEFIPFSDTVRRENIIFNHNILLQSGLRKVFPLDVVKIDKILNSILKEKNLSARISIRYLDKQDSCQYFSNRGYWFEVQSSIIEVGIKKEMEVQAFIAPSVSWMLRTLPNSVKISYLLFIILTFILLSYFYWRLKRVKVAYVTNIPIVICTVDFQKLYIADNGIDEADGRIIKEIPVYIEKSIRKLDSGDYQIGSFYLDVSRRCLMKDNYCRYVGKRREYTLLMAFLKAKDHSLSVQKVVDILEIKNYKFNNQLNAAITRLRSLLKMDPDIEIVLKKEKYILLLR